MLLALSSSSHAYYEQFGKHLDNSVNYLRSISKRIDSLTVPSVRGTRVMSAENIQLGVQEAEEKTAYNLYTRNHDVLCRELELLAENKQRLILKTISYDQLHEREFAIPEAHHRTFQWILSTTGRDNVFVEWLRYQNGMFWISGKAGSGKSSLMRFLVDHATTHRLLTEWADPRGCQSRTSIVVAKHYFWRHGTLVQRSQEGLMRSILLQVLLQRPGLIKEVCRERWAAPYADSFYPWTRAQLKLALTSLAHIDTKVCLFIDGLDEYGGDHRELVKILCQLSESPNIKVCVSSRPWVDFDNAFGDSPWTICLQDLTKQDILEYVTDELEQEEAFRKLWSNSHEAALEIIQRITEKSEGIFLWVYLVVRSLIRGLVNGDDLHTLRTRLDSLPKDLEDYFMHILLDIEEIYRPRTARLFLTLCYAGTSFPVLTFFFLNLDDDPDHSGAVPETQQEPLELLSDWPDVDSELFESLISKKRQLVAQCKDMIRITPDPKAHILFGEKVGFLHRTIVDFIRTDNVFKGLETLSGVSFDPRRILFHANLGQTRSLIHLHRLTYIRMHLTQWILGCLFFAYEIEVTAPHQYGSISTGLDELEGIIMRGFARWDFESAIQTLLDEEGIFSFLELAAMCDLKAYVQRRHPDCDLPTTLDNLAPRWRSPCRVQLGEVKQFEIFRQEDDEPGSWRLGSCLNSEESPHVPGTTSDGLGAPESHKLDHRSQNTSTQVINQRRRSLWKKVTAAFR